jgi:hypothetical protein
MAFLEVYLGLLVGFLSLTIATSAGLAPKLRAKMEAECESMQEDANTEYPPTTEWTVESFFDLIDRKMELEEIRITCNQRIGGLMSMCTLLVFSAIGGLTLAFTGFLPETLPMLDFFIYAFAGLYAIRIVPIAYRIA